MMADVLDQGAVSDAALAILAANGDRVAFAELVERHYDFVFRLAYRLTGRRHDAEDLAQDVCIRLGRAIRSFRGDGAFTTWLYQLVLNAVRDQARKNKRDALKTEAYGREPAGESDEDDRAERLWAVVRALPEKQREAVTLVYGEGLPHAAAAALMNCAETTVSWHIGEAKKRLKLLASTGEG